MSCLTIAYCWKLQHEANKSLWPGQEVLVPMQSFFLRMTHRRYYPCNKAFSVWNALLFKPYSCRFAEKTRFFAPSGLGSFVLLKTYAEYYEGFDEETPSGETRHHEGERELVDTLRTRFPLDTTIPGEQDEKDFISLFGSVLRVRNILAAFDDFRGNELLSPRDFQDYQSIYLDLYDKYRTPKADKEDITADIVFEMELMRQVEINLDYILMLVEKLRASHGEDKTILGNILHSDQFQYRFAQQEGTHRGLPCGYQCVCVGKRGLETLCKRTQGGRPCRTHSPGTPEARGNTQVHGQCLP